MISVSDKKWLETIVNKRKVQKISQDLGFSNFISTLIVSRKFDQSEIYSISNNIHYHNLFKDNKDFEKSVDVITESIKKKETICIFGDYDVDGSCSTALLARFFSYIGQPYFYFIPDREKDGYGPNVEIFKRIIKKKAKLIILVDCGSGANNEIKYLNDKNIRSIIIDHHEINKPFPKATVIINTKKDNGYIEYDYFCATTLTYFFLIKLIKKLKSNFKLPNYLIYVLLASICDVMPLRKYNRFIAQEVLSNLNIENNKFISEIFNLTNKKNILNVNDLGFLIGPILNSGGRLGNSLYATDLLTTDNDLIIKKKSADLIKLNNKRKIIEELILKEIDFKKLKKNNRDIIIYVNKSINEGLIGIISSRLKDLLGKPSITITTSGKYLKGSARSTPGYNIGKLMKRLLDNKIIEKGGGHYMAAGFVLKKEKLSSFLDFVSEDFKIKNKVSINNFYDAEVSPKVVNNNFYNELNKLAPFGLQNPNPMFLIKDLKIFKNIILKDKHISSIFKSKTGFVIRSIAFNSVDTAIGDYLLNYKKDLNVIGQINQNIWNNKKTLQLVIKDLVI